MAQVPRTISQLYCIGSTYPRTILYRETIVFSSKAGSKLVVPRCSRTSSCTNVRRSANYHPSIWDPKFIESITTPYSYKSSFVDRLEELKEETKKLFKASQDTLALLKIVDSIQRLGVAYHFEQEINEAIELLANASNSTNDDLYATSLRFRLLRQHGHQITTEVFDKFRNRDGEFMELLSTDTAGLLSLYEATHLGTCITNDDVLEVAKEFSIRNLKSMMGNMGCESARQVKHALSISLHGRMTRLEAWNHIKAYQNGNKMSSLLLELAKLDYNMVQSIHQVEVKELSGWWQGLEFKEKLDFSRDRLMENYLWAMGIAYEPEYSQCRIGLTKYVCILTTIDDIYDVYGSLDELELFTTAVERWDVKAMDCIPEYMKICYQAMLDFGNGLAHDVLKQHGQDALPHIRREWTKLCKSYLVEARWFNSNYKPSVDEYLKNAWISVGGPGAMVHAYLLQGLPLQPINSSDDPFNHLSELFYWSSMITRLSDDLGTSQYEILRGDVSKSIQCFMNEEGLSEDQARAHIEDLKSICWKKLNYEAATSSYPTMVNMSLNMARTAQSIFEHGDGIGTSTGVTKDRLISLIINPIM